MNDFNFWPLRIDMTIKNVTRNCIISSTFILCMYFKELDNPMFSYVRLFSDGLIVSELGIRFTNYLSACISFL